MLNFGLIPVEHSRVLCPQNAPIAGSAIQQPNNDQIDDAAIDEHQEDRSRKDQFIDYHDQIGEATVSNKREEQVSPSYLPVANRLKTKKPRIIRQRAVRALGTIVRWTLENLELVVIDARNVLKKMLRKWELNKPTRQTGWRY